MSPAIPLEMSPRGLTTGFNTMSIAIIDRSAGEEGTWKTAKTFLLGFVIGEAFLLALFSFVL